MGRLKGSKNRPKPTAPTSPVMSHGEQRRLESRGIETVSAGTPIENPPGRCPTCSTEMDVTTEWDARLPSPGPGERELNRVEWTWQTVKYWCPKCMVNFYLKGRAD